MDVVGAAGLQNTYFVTSAYYEGKDIDPDLKKMVDAYQSKFKTFPENLNAIVGYQTMLVLAEGLKAAGSTDAAALTKAILSQKDVKVPGMTYFGWNDRYPSVSAVVVGFAEDGSFKQIEILDPRQAK